MLKKIIKWGGLLLFLPFLAAVIHNNIGSSDIIERDLRESHREAVGWVVSNKHRLLTDHNSMLWWMLERSNQLLPSPELNAVVQEYRRLHGARYISSPWSYLITGQKPILTEPFAFVDQLPDYNVQFIYGFSCDRKLAEQPIVQRQNNTSFCWRYHPISPACITHQMMGFRFMERARCNAMPDLRDKLDTLSGTARWQSRLDFRVVDVYLQRVVMQIDSGFADRVNPRWLKRILREQGDDGGWDDFQPLLPLGGEKAIGFSGRGFKVGDTSSNFHATAQGIWLMSYLLGKPSTFQSVMQ